MEHTNPDKKTLKELLQEANEKGLKLILVQEPVMDGHHRLLAMIKMEQVMVVGYECLLPRDQEMVSGHIGLGPMQVQSSNSDPLRSHMDEMAEKVNEDIIRSINKMAMEIRAAEPPEYYPEISITEPKRKPLSKGNIKQMNRNVQAKFKNYKRR
jgi:hypothetical protein